MGKIITDAIETNAGTDLVFTVGGAERMRIATNGKISTQGEFSTGGKVTSLVGNQKSEFSQIKSLGNTNSLQVGTNEVNSLTIGQIGGEYSGIGYNVNFDGSVQKFRGTDTASLLKFHNGGFEFLGTPATGAANGTTPITFSSLMSIGNTGLVTIGRVGGPPTSLSVIGQAQSSIGTTAGSSANTLVTKDYVDSGTVKRAVYTDTALLHNAVYNFGATKLALNGSFNAGAGGSQNSYVDYIFYTNAAGTLGATTPRRIGGLLDNANDGGSAISGWIPFTIFPPAGYVAVRFQFTGTISPFTVHCTI